MEPLIVDHSIHLPKGFITDLNKLCFQIPNPKATFASKFSKIPKYINVYRELEDEILLPRNFPIHMFWKGPIDRRISLNPTIDAFDKLQSNVVPWDYQEKIIFDVLANPRDQVIVAPCGGGKTTIGSDIVRRFRRKAVIVVPTTQLLRQWKQRLKKNYNIEAGVFYGEEKNVKDVTIVLIQSLLKMDYEDMHIFEDVDLLMVDECHMLGAEEWNKPLSLFKAAYRIGLTATDSRSDGLDMLMHYAIGPVYHRIRHRDLVEKGVVLLADYITLDIDDDSYIVMKKNPRAKYDKFSSSHILDFVETCSLMAENDYRNGIIFNAIINCVKNNRKILFLSNRLKQIDWMFDRLRSAGVNVGKLTGETTEAEEEAALNCQVVTASQSMAKLGLDNQALDTLFMGTPMSDEGLVTQAIGRITRKDPTGKKRKPLVVIPKDVKSPELLKMFESVKTKVLTPLGVTQR